MYRQPWFEDEDKLLRKMAGRYCVEDITRSINAFRMQYSLPPRTYDVVQRRSRRMKISLLPSGVLFVVELQKIFGISYRTVHLFMEQGWLKGRTWGTCMHVFDEAEVFQLIDNRPWLFDIESIRPGPFRKRLELLTRRDPWMNSLQAAEILGCARKTVCAYLRAGKIEHEKRLGHNGEYMIRASQIPTMRQVLRIKERPQKLAA